jgi:mRNA interferase RelE/StbE
MKISKFIRSKVFKRKFTKLPINIQEKFVKQLNLLINDYLHRSLNVKKMHGVENIWEARITHSYRFTFNIEGNICKLRNIGTHDILQKP